MKTDEKTTVDLLAPNENEKDFVIQWFQCSKEFHENDPKKQARYIEICKRSIWVEIGSGISAPMMPGLGIKEAIKEHKIPKVKRVSWENYELAPYGLYGIEGHYKNGRAVLFFVDSGCSISTLCSLWFEKNDLS